MDWTLYGLTKVNKQLSYTNKKLLYSGLIHSHLVFGLPIWGFASQGRLNTLLTKQKKAIRKIYNLKYKEHTLPFFQAASILRLPELIKHTTLCYIHSGLDKDSPSHIKKLWKLKKISRENLRDRGIQIEYPLSPKQWINALPPIAQAKLWNSISIRKDVAKTTFKLDSKLIYQSEYALELYNNQEIYADYWKAKKEEEQQNKPLTEDQCIMM